MTFKLRHKVTFFFFFFFFFFITCSNDLSPASLPRLVKSERMAFLISWGKKKKETVRSFLYSRQLHTRTA